MLQWSSSTEVFLSVRCMDQLCVPAWARLCGPECLAEASFEPQPSAEVEETYPKEEEKGSGPRAALHSLVRTCPRGREAFLHPLASFSVSVIAARMSRLSHYGLPQPNSQKTKDDLSHTQAPCSGLSEHH